jgi:hypothetical protein
LMQIVVAVSLSRYVSDVVDIWILSTGGKGCMTNSVLGQVDYTTGLYKTQQI